MAEIVARDLEFVSNGSDAGLVFNARCPKCHEEITVAEMGWWRTTCSCGHTWWLRLEAYAEVEEEVTE